MKIFNSVIIVAILAAAAPAIAQTTAAVEIDCDDPANAEHPDCLALVAPDVVGFVPLIPALAAGVAAAALAVGAGRATTATPGT